MRVARKDGSQVTLDSNGRPIRILLANGAGTISFGYHWPTIKTRSDDWNEKNWPDTVTVTEANAKHWPDLVTFTDASGQVWKISNEQRVPTWKLPQGKLSGVWSTLEGIGPITKVSVDRKDFSLWIDTKAQTWIRRTDGSFEIIRRSNSGTPELQLTYSPDGKQVAVYSPNTKFSWRLEYDKEGLARVHHG